MIAKAILVSHRMKKKKNWGSQNKESVSSLDLPHLKGATIILCPSIHLKPSTHDPWSQNQPRLFPDPLDTRIFEPLSQFSILPVEKSHEVPISFLMRGAKKISSLVIPQGFLNFLCGLTIYVL